MTLNSAITTTPCSVEIFSYQTSLSR